MQMTLLACKSTFIGVQKQSEPISPFYFKENVLIGRIRGSRKCAGQLILGSRFPGSEWVQWSDWCGHFTGSPSNFFFFLDRRPADLEAAYFIFTSEMLLTWDETTLPSTTSSMMVFVTLVLLGSESHGITRSVCKRSLRLRAGEIQRLADCALSVSDCVIEY